MIKWRFHDPLSIDLCLLSLILERLYDHLTNRMWKMMVSFVSGFRFQETGSFHFLFHGTLMTGANPSCFIESKQFCGDTHMESSRPTQVPGDSLPAMWVSHFGSGPFSFSWPFQLMAYGTETSHVAKPYPNCRLVSTIN